MPCPHNNGDAVYPSWALGQDRGMLKRFAAAALLAITCPGLAQEAPAPQTTQVVLETTMGAITVGPVTTSTAIVIPAVTSHSEEARKLSTSR